MPGKALRKVVAQLAMATMTPIPFYLDQTIDELGEWIEAAKREERHG